MKFKLTLLFVLGLISQRSFAQHDSTLIKFVSGLRTVIDTRAKAAGVYIDGRPAAVIMGKSSIRIDSLYKYNIKDFDSISIKFDLPDAVYGHTAKYGVIILHKKE